MNFLNKLLTGVKISRRQEDNNKEIFQDIVGYESIKEVFSLALISSQPQQQRQETDF
jgi:hypothetical protein